MKYALPVAAIALLFSLGCVKNAIQQAPPKVLFSDTSKNLRAVLSGSGLHVFYAALQRTGLDSLLTQQTPVTLFASTDSAMTAAGITLGSLPGWPVDSLSRLLRYHIVSGDYEPADVASSIGNFEAATLLSNLYRDPVNGYSTYDYGLFIGFHQVLYLNGNPVNRGEAAAGAVNGTVYTIDTVLAPPDKTVWQVLASRPELSLYYQACQIDDSSYQATFFSSPKDSPFFSTVTYNATVQSFPVTLLAPVNAAFAAPTSPLHTPDDFRSYASQYDAFNINTQLDDILLQNVVSSSADGFTTSEEVLYNDIAFNPGINNGVFNRTNYYSYDQNYNQVFTYVHFQVQNGAPVVYWGSTFQYGPAHFLPSGKNLIAINGVIHEVDSILYGQ